MSARFERGVRPAEVSKVASWDSMMPADCCLIALQVKWPLMWAKLSLRNQPAAACRVPAQRPCSTGHRQPGPRIGPQEIATLRGVHECALARLRGYRLP